MILGITAHRPDKLGGYQMSQTQRRVRKWMRDKLQQLAPKEVVSGFALGGDLWFADEAVKLRIPLVAAIPFPAQPSRWPLPEMKAEYSRLLSLAARIELISQFNPGTKREATRMLHKRDDWVVRYVDHMLAVWDGSAGGTFHTVEQCAAKQRAWRQVGPPVLRHRHPMLVHRLNPLTWQEELIA